MTEVTQREGVGAWEGKSWREKIESEAIEEKGKFT